MTDIPTRHQFTDVRTSDNDTRRPSSDVLDFAVCQHPGTGRRGIAIQSDAAGNYMIVTPKRAIKLTRSWRKAAPKQDSFIARPPTDQANILTAWAEIADIAAQAVIDDRTAVPFRPIVDAALSGVSS